MTFVLATMQLYWNSQIGLLKGGEADWEKAYENDKQQHFVVVSSKMNWRKNIIQKNNTSSTIFSLLKYYVLPIIVLLLEPKRTNQKHGVITAPISQQNFVQQPKWGFLGLPRGSLCLGAPAEVPAAADGRVGAGWSAPVNK